MYQYLFNFSASYSGGGLKRLEAYCRWFDAAGGAFFIVHPSCESLHRQYANNRYFLLRHSLIDRALNRSSYLADVARQCGPLDLFYCYGIPVQRNLAKINWYHVSNVLPLARGTFGHGLISRTRFVYLGALIRNCWSRCDVISAESHFSLGFVPEEYRGKSLLSENGCDDELAMFSASQTPATPDDVAIVLGTHRHKALADSLLVFRFLERTHPLLRLMIIGERAAVPHEVASDPKVELSGVLRRADVCSRLERSRYYISTTQLENSYNAAAEGVFLAPESYISPIPPHRELMSGWPYEEVAIPGLREPLLRIRKDQVDPSRLRRWDDIIKDVVHETQRRLELKNGPGTHAVAASP